MKLGFVVRTGDLYIDFMINIYSTIINWNMELELELNLGYLCSNWNLGT